MLHPVLFVGCRRGGDKNLKAGVLNRIWEFKLIDMALDRIVESFGDLFLIW
jgi:hypothetical protein